MTDSSEPLRENEVGIFGELAKRPNPDNLVIVQTPPVDDLLPVLQSQMGRKPTPEEIEVQRCKAPAIVLSRATAEKLAASRLIRPATIPAEPVQRAPTVTSSYHQLPADPTDRNETVAELFGQHLFSLRNRLADSTRRLVESPEVRGRLGALHRQEYDFVGTLSPEQRDAALALARKAVDLYLHDILVLLTGTGDSLRFGPEHAINYRLVLEVKEIASDEVVEAFDVNRDCKRAFFDYFGRWMNRYRDHR